jgi:hypothetical protein
VQVLKVISNQESEKEILKASMLKYKCLITDGAAFCTAILPQQFNSDIKKGLIKQFTVINVSHSHNTTTAGEK